MMECDIDYPHGRYVEHIITWRKQGDEVRIITPCRCPFVLPFMTTMLRPFNCHVIVMTVFFDGQRFYLD